MLKSSGHGAFFLAGTAKTGQPDRVKAPLKPLAQLLPDDNAWKHKFVKRQFVIRKRS